MSTENSFSSEEFDKTLLDFSESLPAENFPDLAPCRDESKALGYAKRLKKIQDECQGLEFALNSWMKRTEKYYLNRLKIHNQQILLENQELKSKILQIEEAQKKERKLEIITVSNTSLRTQATEWYLSKEISFSVSSCSSIDSIALLNEQVDNIKDTNSEKHKKARTHIHNASNSIQSFSKIEKFFAEVRRKVSLGTWASNDSLEISQNEDLCSEKKTPAKFLNYIFLNHLPTFRI
jgi:hypothetical protein